MDFYEAKGSSNPATLNGAHDACSRGLTWRENMKSPKIRNPVAYALALRGQGKAMKHRSIPRGGATNDTLELLRLAAEEEYYEEEPDGPPDSLRSVRQGDQSGKH